MTTTGIRDNIAAVDRNPAEIAVREIMSGSLILAKPEWTVKECSQFMKKHNIHHLPVADEYGTLVGLISATDIFIAVEEGGWGEGEK